MKNIAFVTSVDSVLGYNISLRLIQKGWHVFAGQLMPDNKNLSKLIAKFPHSISAVTLDVASDDSVKEAARFVAGLTVKLDLLINNAEIYLTTMDKKIGEAQEYDEMLSLYNSNALGPVRVVDAFLPIMDKSDKKRLCFVTSEAGSINASESISGYGYCMSKASLNMAVKILFNRLRPEGYTFRLYHPGMISTCIGVAKNPTVNPEVAGIYAVEYFLRNRSFEPKDTGHSDENRLVMRDWKGREWPW